MQHHQHLRVFVAAPKDVLNEKQCVKRIIDKLNNAVSLPLGVTLEYLSGEDTATPVMSDRPQSPISPIVDQCDIFIGILWTRFGTPPGKTAVDTSYVSGTEEEFHRALTRWRTNGAKETASPHIMMFFSERKCSPGDYDAEQFIKVTAFRNNFGPEGEHPGLYDVFQNTRDFNNKIYKHLLNMAISLSGGAARADLIPDFVLIPPDDWIHVLTNARYIRLAVMYARTWRNTYLQLLRNHIKSNGELSVVLPRPSNNNKALSLMAENIGTSADDLIERIVESKEEFMKLRNFGFGKIDVRYTDAYIHHALYLSDNGGILALYAYRRERVASPAIRLQTGPLHEQSLLDFDALFRESKESLEEVVRE